MGGWVWGLGRCFGIRRSGFGLARGSVGIGRDGFVMRFWGGWVGTGGVCRLVGWGLEVVGCYWGMGV